MEKTEIFRPFSNGTSAMIWYSENCETCKKAYFPKDGEYPPDKTMKQYCSTGRECKLKYALDFAFITGEIPMNVAEQIGIEDGGLKETCMFWSDNEDDGFKPPKRPKPDRTPDNQLVMPFALDEILQGHKLKQLTTAASDAGK